MLVAGSDLVVRLAGYGRGYWVPLTVLVVLRPDFASTFQRAIMRVVGTVIGLLLATELLHWIPGGELVLHRADRGRSTSASGWPGRATSA